MNKGGRPSDYNQEIAADICAHIAEGQSMRTICQGDDMPAMSTVFRWLAKHEEFQEQYARAKNESAEAMIEDMLAIADHGSRTDTQRARLRVDTRKWIASKLKPKKYGDKLQQEHSGNITIEAVSFADIDPEQLDP